MFRLIDSPCSFYMKLINRGHSRYSEICSVGNGLCEIAGVKWGVSMTCSGAFIVNFEQTLQNVTVVNFEQENAGWNTFNFK